MIHNRLETLIDEMLEGQILLDEAMAEFEKLYIKKALARLAICAPAADGFADIDEGDYSVSWWTPNTARYSNRFPYEFA